MVINWLAVKEKRGESKEQFHFYLVKYDMFICLSNLLLLYVCYISAQVRHGFGCRGCGDGRCE
jgi:hypothetical protein